MRTERVDPRDSAAFGEWHDALLAGTTAGREYAVCWQREEMRLAMVDETPYFEREIWAVRDGDGEIAGVVALFLPLKDNTSLVTVDLCVVPERRREGAGTALARVVEERVVHHGRKIVQGMVHSPLDGVAAGEGFALANGLTLGLVDLHRVLELPLDQAYLEELAAEVAEHHRDYRLVSWQNRCPDELVDAYAALEGTFLSEAPLGELELEEEVYDAARIRFREKQSREQGRRSWVTVAIAPDGALVGQTELFMPGHDPLNAYQSGTLVASAHRGHRLGLALKVRNHLELQRDRTGHRIMHTWNAEQNTAMNAVNERLGYRPVERSGEWQRRI
ncbi:GNAT family N-acetyltransferase [Kribbella sp. CA-293567]|uniref:GNAT family N-acetyltransferase n=1 Tax=Kribbella sp. CA-293567 TaxID=3002436 RepID=UPI0022DDBE83|nr:GNAT family N-acetyltransferase [Kribbella sp. CA-293567]WBQ06417.1 GNAT family N-acetyltransferase [Kribbella sp. CA-293567]